MGIINCASIQAIGPSETLLDYASTKAAINNFTVNLAATLGERGIRVNSVAPRPIWTPLQPATKVSVKDFGMDAPLGRPASRSRWRRRSSTARATRRATSPAP